MAFSISYAPLVAPTTQKAASPAQVGSASQKVVQSIVYGNGLLAPFRRDGKGDFAHSNDIAVVRSNLKQVLGTQASGGRSIGEIPWRPEFGTVLQLLRYRNLDETTVELARTYVVDAIATWMPRIRLKQTEVESDPALGTLTLRVIYDILSSSRQTVLINNVQDSLDIPLAA